MPRTCMNIFGFLVLAVSLLLGFLATKYAPTPASDELSLPPGSLGLPILGETLDVLLGSTDWLDERVAKFGPVSRSYFMLSDTIIFGGLEGAKIFYDQSKIIRKDHQPGFLARMLPANVGSKYGPVHRAHKPIVMAAMRQETFDRAMPEITKGVHELLGKLDAAQDVQDFDLLQQIQLWNYDCLCLILLSDVDAEFKNVYPAVIGDILNAAPIDVPGTPFNGAVNTIHEKVLPWLETKVHEHMNNPGKYAGDGLSSMIAANQKSDMPMSAAELSYELHHLFTAGLAVNSPLSNFLMTLDREPAVLAALRKEALAAPYDPQSGVTSDRMASYPLLSAAYLESRRMNPNVKAAFGKTRTAFNYTTLSGTTYTIPENWAVMLFMHSVHLDPTNHVNPQTFSLERFEGKSDLEAAENFEVVAQGGGKQMGHLCAGWELSGRLIRSLLVPLLREYRFSFHDNDERPTFKPEVFIAYPSKFSLKEFNVL